MVHVSTDYPCLIYNDASPSAIDRNDDTIAKIIAGTDQTGGGITLDCGTVHFSKWIAFPQPFFQSGASANRPVHFFIRGNAASVLHYHGDGKAIFLSPEYPAQMPGGYVRWTLDDFTLIGGGIRIEGGGKFTSLRNINVCKAPIGFDVQWFDGGAFAGLCNAFSCGIGAKFEQCMHVNFDRLICRDNDTGLVSIGCVDWSGSIYVESNRGLQADFLRLRRSSIAIWAEARTDNSNPAKLVRRRESVHNVWSGVVQDRQWDDDAISRVRNRTLTDDVEFAPIGEPLQPATAFTPYGGIPLLAGEGLTVICRPGCFAQQGDRMGEIRGFDPDWDDPLKALHYRAGDTFQVLFDVTCDDKARDWLAGEAPFACWSTTPPVKVTALPIDAETTHHEALGITPADGMGFRLFLFLLPRRNNEAEHRFTLSRIEVRHLRGDK